MKKSTTTKRHSTIPANIEVRWKLPGGRPVWWRAEVVQVRLQRGNGIQNTKACLQYEGAYGFPPTRYQVRFRNATSLEHILENNENSVSTWRARHIRRRDPVKTDKLTISPHSRATTKIAGDINTLRRGILKNTAHLDELRRSLDMRQALKSRQELDYTTRRELEVLGFLTHRMAIELRNSPRTTVRPHRCVHPSTLPEMEPSRRGITRTSIRISADCEQRVFELIAKRIHDTSGNLRATPLFRPEYELTQLPSQGSHRFSISLGSFSDLCQCIGIDSSSDRLSMMCRYGMSKGEGTMRILGSLEHTHQDDSDPLDFFVGSSCGHNYEIGDAAPTQQTQAMWTIHRENSAWNREDHRYETPLETKSFTCSRTVRQACLDKEKETGDSFEVSWRRAKEVSRKTWSRAITQSEIIVGKIELVLPCIIVTGSVLCDEYTTGLTDELLRSVIR